MDIIFSVIRWITATTMWIMALVTLTFGGLGIIGAILFAIVGIMISPLSSKFIFPRIPNLKNSHKIISIAGIWLAANVFLGLSPAATASNTASEAMSTVAVSEASIENVDRSMADISTVEASEEVIIAEPSSNSSTEKTSEESTDKSTSSSSTTTTTKSMETTSVASTGTTIESATTEATVDTSAGEATVAQKAEESATQQPEAEAVAAEQPDSSTVPNGTENANALAVLQMGPTTGAVCWVPRHGGTKYHSKSTCSSMDDPICTTVDTAEACGFEACKRCH